MSKSGSKKYTFKKPEESIPLLVPAPAEHYGSTVSKDERKEMDDIISKYEEVTVMVAGKPRNGKTTALKNIFGIDVETHASAKSVTRAVKSYTLEKSSVTVNVVDTPGLGALDIDRTSILEDMSAIDRGESFTLLYCLSVSPSSSLTEMDVKIIKNIHALFGIDIWSRCFLVLTFSDTARRDEFPVSDGFPVSNELSVSDEGYIEYLRDHVQEFEKILKKCSSEIPDITLIFDCNEKTPKGNMIAFPAAKFIKLPENVNILPTFPVVETIFWTDTAFIKILEKSGKLAVTLIRLRYNLIAITATTGGGMAVGAVIGTAIGAGVGAVVGVAGGPIGVGVGAGAGAAIGLGVGTALALPGSTIISSLVTALKYFRSKNITQVEF